MEKSLFILILLFCIIGCKNNKTNNTKSTYQDTSYVDGVTDLETNEIAHIKINEYPTEGTIKVTELDDTLYLIWGDNEGCDRYVTKEVWIEHCKEKVDFLSKFKNSIYNNRKKELEYYKQFIPCH